MKKIRIPIPAIRWLNISWGDEATDRNRDSEPSYDAGTKYAAQYRYYKRKRQERAALGLQTNTGKPLKKKSWKYRTEPAPEYNRKQDRGEASWQKTPFYLKYGETQTAMAKRYGVTKEAIRRVWASGQCPEQYYTDPDKRKRGRRANAAKARRAVANNRPGGPKGRILRLCERAGYDRPLTMLTENRSEQKLEAVIYRHGLGKIGPKSLELMQRYQRRFCGPAQLKLL